MKRLRIIGILVLMAGAYSPGSAQFYETRITPITDETGASPGATFAILEDTMGFMWFGTTDGLYRYDGYNYRIFRFDPESENSLSDNTIRGMAYDQKCYLWIATQGGGLDRFNLLTEEFKHYRNTGAQENEISGNSLWALMIDRSGNIWIGVTGKGVDRLDQETNTFTHFNPLTGEKTLRQEQTIRTLVEGKSGVILVGIPDYGLSVINPESGKVRSFNVSDEIGHGLSNSMIYDMLLSDDGKLWICTYGGGINIHNTRKGKFEYLRQRNKINPLLSDLTYAIAMRRSSEIWIGTEYGINCYNPEKGEMRIFKKGEDANFSLSDNRIREIFVDKKGIVWAGSESGVDKIVTNKNFRVFRHSKDEQDGMAEGIVRAILEDDHENLWIGLVENGLVRYDKHSGVYKHYIWDAGVPGSIPGNNINALYQDSEGTLWIGEWWSGLIRYNAKNDAFSNVANANLGGNTLNDNRIQVIREEPPGILWIGTENGINRFNIAKGEFTYFKHEEGNPQSLSGNAIQSNAFIFDHEKNLWAGTWSFGLNKIEFLDPEQKELKFYHWTRDPGNPSSLNNDNVIALLEDDNDIIWIGTFGGGLTKFDTKTDIFKAYTTEDGLPNNIVFAVIKDDRGMLWLSTDNGISMFDPQKETFQNYTKADGLQDNHFFWGASHISRQGEIYFGGINGLNSFFPEAVKPDMNPARPVIVEIRLFNVPVKLEQASYLVNDIEFRHNENFISFEFAALDFTKPEQNRYKYMLEGFDKDWIYPGNSRTASYTNLSPGRYTFRLMVSNSFGIWNEKTSEITIFIRPPWWRTWWAISIFVLLLFFMVYSFIIIRFRILRNQKKMLEHEVMARTSEIVNKNLLLEKQTYEISSQNKKLNQQKKELAIRNMRLKNALERLEQTQKALVRSEKMASLGVLTAGVAHEINNPLNFIAVSIESLKDEMEDIGFDLLKESNPDNFQVIQKLLEHAESGIERIINITDRLKTYAHKGQEEDELFNIDEVIESSLNLMVSKIPSFINVEKNLRKVPLILGQKYQISQVIVNIIDNAVDAINEKKKRGNEWITIYTSEEMVNRLNYVLVRISNSGPPISDKILENIFDPFFTTKEPNKGTGLGLYLSYNIIKEHKGLFSVENKNKRVNFIIHFPAFTE